MNSHSVAVSISNCYRRELNIVYEIEIEMKRAQGQPSIIGFLKKSKKNKSRDGDDSQRDVLDEPISDETPITVRVSNENLHPQIADQSDTSTHASPKTNAVDPKLDIGNIDRSSLDDYTKKLILTSSMISKEKSRDLTSAVEHVHEIVNMLQEERKTAEVSVRKIFIEAEKLANGTFDMELKVPRLTLKQTTRSNHQTDSVESYFRSAVFIPCLDTLIQTLSDKFLNENAGILSSLQILLPGFAAIEKVDDLHHLSPYFDDQVSESAVKAEYKLWCEKLSGLEEDSGVLQVLDFYDKSRFPTIKYLLTVLATLAVTTASVERSFSTMKRIKTYLRNSTGNERLSALAVLSIHGNLGIDPNEVLEIMAAKKS